MSYCLSTDSSSVSSAPIVIVDDEAHCRELVQYALVDLGFSEGLLANNGEEARRQIETLTAAGIVPRVLLLDLELPGEHGRELLREIRSQPKLQNMACIIMTSVDDHKERQRCLEIGADDYWVKPDNYNGLLLLMSGLHRYL